MDANTTSVLKSVLDIVSIIVTALMVVYVARSNNKMNEVRTKVDVVEKKLDENHKLTNGHIKALLETTAALATAKEKKKGDDALSEEKKKKT